MANWVPCGPAHRFARNSLPFYLKGSPHPPSDPQQPHTPPPSYYPNQKAACMLLRFGMVMPQCAAN